MRVFISTYNVLYADDIAKQVVGGAWVGGRTNKMADDPVVREWDGVGRRSRKKGCPF